MPLRRFTELGPRGVQRENPGRGRSGNTDHHYLGEGVGPILRIDNSNPEGTLGRISAIPLARVIAGADGLM
jgi:hypothetical protein